MRYAPMMYAYLPLAYFFATRQIEPREKISWLIIQAIPTLAITTVFSSYGLWLCWLMTVAGFLAWQSAYEVGYIYNDVFTVKNERNPTLRLEESHREFLEKRFYLIAVWRFLLALALLLATVCIGIQVQDPVHALVFLVLMIVAQVAFCFHNLLRDRRNIISYAVLTSSRYAAVPLLVVPFSNYLEVTVICLVMMPLPRLVEHACKPKYGLDRWADFFTPFPAFRATYYLVAFFVCLVLVWLVSFPIFGAIVLAYYGVYRAAIYYAMRKGSLRNTAHQAYDKTV